MFSILRILPFAPANKQKKVLAPRTKMGANKPAVIRPAKIKPVTIQKEKKVRKNQGLLSGVGSALGSAFGPSGSVIGAAAGDLLGDLFGWGDYEAIAPVNYPINNNSVVGVQTPLASQIPMMHGEDGSCRIRKREYIQDVNMTSNFVTDAFGLNPTDPRTFPWLSSIATKFEQYKFLGLAFGFRSLTANALGSTGNPSMGSVTMLTQYDVLDLVVTTKTEANNALYATSCKPAESMLHPVECDPEQTPNLPLYTGANEYNPTLPDAARDLRLNYLGFTTVATQGAPETDYLAGELWVTYDVMLYKPMVFNPNPGVSGAVALGLRKKIATETKQCDVEDLCIVASVSK